MKCIAGIIEAVKKSAEIVTETSEREKDTEIPKQIRELILKRETLKRKKEKSAIEKTELKSLCKQIKKELRQYNSYFTKQITTFNKSWKQQKVRGTSKSSSHCEEDGLIISKMKKYGTKMINEIAIKFYKKPDQEED